VRVRTLPLFALLTGGILVLTGCGTAPDAAAPTAAQETPTRAPDELPTSAPEPTPDPYPGWKTYTNESFGLSFRYPSTWFGPDVYEFEDGVRLAVGSDVVYPYGTGPEDRQPGAPNAYGVIIQYTANTSGWTLEQYRTEQPWLNDYLSVLDMQDGESSTTARSLTIRVRGLTVGRFTGVEFVGTLSDTAQTERYYSRNAFLMDEDGNVLTVMGSPENAEIADPANWRETFEAVDAANRDVLYGLIDSIEVE
jgi:hypothetical protein